MKKMADHQNDASEAAFAAAIGHVFARPSLLTDALTHPSLSGASGKKRVAGGAPYERLEFLGDRVLGLVIAEWLYALFPSAKEGELAKRHAALVNRDALQEVASRLGVDRHLRLAHGEEPGQGRKNLVALSDAMEAVIGAIYLDGGLQAAAEVIHRAWADTIKAGHDAPPVDPKTALQEWAQARGLPLPQYVVLERSGPAHAPVFVIEAAIAGFAPAMARGASKRIAEKEAAACLLNIVNQK